MSQYGNYYGVNDKEIKSIENMLKSNLPEKMRKDLERKKTILMNNKMVEK